jgi:hypothetical protein
MAQPIKMCVLPAFAGWFQQSYSMVQSRRYDIDSCPLKEPRVGEDWANSGLSSETWKLNSSVVDIALYNL